MSQTHISASASGTASRTSPWEILSPTPQHAHWEALAKVMRTVSIQEKWRGCFGLAFSLTDYPVDGLYPAEALQVETLVDVPVGHWPGCRLNSRAVMVARTGRFVLHHNMPLLRVDEPMVDFSTEPFGIKQRTFGRFSFETEQRRASGDTLNSDHEPVRFGVLNAVNAKMVEFARCTVLPLFDRQGQLMLDKNGQVRTRPARPAWFDRQKAAEAPDVEGYLPVAWLAYRPSAGLLDGIYWAATSSHSEDVVWDCPHCKRSVCGHDLKRLRSFRVLDNDKVVSDCPACHRHDVTWYLDEARPGRVERRFSTGFRADFCAAVAAGLPIPSPIDGTYAGTAKATHTPMGDNGKRIVDLVCHKLLDATGKATYVYLPADARVLVAVGEAVGVGTAWAHACEPCETFGGWSIRRQWCELPGRFHGNVSLMAYLQRLWFQLKARPVGDLIAWPAAWLTTATREYAPAALYFSLPRLAKYFDAALDSYILPPVRLKKWDQLEFQLPGDLRVDLRIRDPRFDPVADRNGRHSQSPGERPGHGPGSARGEQRTAIRTEASPLLSLEEIEQLAPADDLASQAVQVAVDAAAADLQQTPTAPVQPEAIHRPERESISRERTVSYEEEVRHWLRLDSRSGGRLLRLPASAASSAASSAAPGGAVTATATATA